MTALHRLVTSFLLLKLLNLAVNLLAFPRLDARMPRSVRQPVSLLIPARDEASVLARTLPLFLSQDVDEVLLLDDCSSDGTGAAARCIAGRDSRFRVIPGRAAPAGWTGKTWACHQLGGQANGSTLIFCDADVTLAPGAIDAALWQQGRQRADVLSVFARQITGSMGERLLAPVIDDVLLCFLPHPLLRAPVPSAATASGGLLVFSRAAYERLGGFAGVRTELVEDVAMARRVRRVGLQLGLALGGDLVATRMYDGYADAVVAFGRGVHGVLGQGPLRLFLPALGLWHALVYLAPLLLCRRPAWAMLLALGLVERIAIEAKTGRRQWADALLMPITPLAMLPVLIQAMRPRQRWKGRLYA